MTLIERLNGLVRFAPPGTLVPVESLREMIEDADPEPPAAATPGLSLSEVAERCAEIRGEGARRVPTRGAVRKWIREGLRGVKLEAYSFGRSYRVTEEALGRFVERVRLAEQRRPPRSPQLRMPVEGGDAKAEIASAKRRFGRERSE
jgi:hypothetical protein